MIATLEGVVSRKSEETMTLDVGGVGYAIYVTAEDLGRLKTKDKVKFFIYEHIRDSIYDLYGFIDLNNKNLFEQLLGVNGVGPKMALSILSIGSVSQVKSAIADGDVKFLQRATGVGKRVAERAIVELKDKVGLDSSSGDTILTKVNLKTDEAIHALIALGFTANDAADAIKHVPKDLPTDQRVRMALKGK